VIYIPSTKGDVTIPRSEFEKRIEDTTRWISERFGGATNISGFGSWVDSTGRVIQEDVVKIESFLPFTTYKREDEEVKNLLTDKACEWEQQSISFEYESPAKPSSSLYLVSCKKKLEKVV